MAYAASQTWENGVMVERAKETNRHRVLPDGTVVGEDIDFTPEPKAYKTPTPRHLKMVAEAENKAVKKAAKKK